MDPNDDARWDAMFDFVDEDVEWNDELRMQEDMA